MSNPIRNNITQLPVFRKSPQRIKRREDDKKTAMEKLINQPLSIQRELNNRSFYEFFLYFWDCTSNDELVPNWHIRYLCDVLQAAAERVADKKPKLKDLMINIPPGTSKTSIVCILFPVWCWSRWYWMRFITASYAEAVSLESGESSRDVIYSKKFQDMYPDLRVKADKSVKSNYRVEKLIKKNGEELVLRGGNRLSTSVGAKATGFHGHINIVDDANNPYETLTNTIMEKTNYWFDKVLSNRKTDKKVTLTIIVMQRLHENDLVGHLLNKKAAKFDHICLPGCLDTGKKYLQPKKLEKYYRNGLLDPERLDRGALAELELDLGQYGYAGQIDQNPTPPGGGMFKVDMLEIIDHMVLPHEIDRQVRAWDKAGTQGGGAHTVGAKMIKIKQGPYQGKFLIVDVKRGQWGTDVREKHILTTAEADTRITPIVIEQELGSGGKESAEATVKMLAGFKVKKECPRGDKIYRADPFSVQVNNGNVLLLRGEWNKDFVDELRNFPVSKYKDQVDASAMAFSYLTSKKKAGAV